MGLDADVHRPEAIPHDVRHRHGLRNDETIFMCRKQRTDRDGPGHG